MLVTTRTLPAALLWCLVATAGCGSDGAPSAPSQASSSTTTPTPATKPSTANEATPTTEATAVSLDGVRGELILTRQRDLLDRGLINVELVNDSAEELTITGRQLIIDHFATEPAAPRTSFIPNGRPIHLQVPFGVVDDCDSPTGVDAWLEFTFTPRGASTESMTRISLTGTEILDAIRSEQCAERAFDAAFDVSYSEPMIDGDQFDVEVTFTPSASSTSAVSEVEVQRTFGTILVGVETPALPVTIGARAESISVEFFVIRCDPHAMAEVTKRFGLELLVVIDGAPGQLIDIDVTPLESALTDIVEYCQRQPTTPET